MNEWISVKDELPKGDKQIICYSSNNGGYAFIDYLGLKNMDWCLCFNVTHWMPLPEMPKEKR